MSRKIFLFLATAFFLLGGFYFIANAAAPAMPTNLTVSARSSCSVNLNWVESDASTAKFDMKQVEGMSAQTIAGLATSSWMTGITFLNGRGNFYYIDTYSWNRLSVPNVYTDPNRTYRYQVRSVSSAGEASSWTAASGLVTTPGFPNTFSGGAGAPTAVIATSTNYALKIDFKPSIAMSARFAQYGGFWLFRIPAFSSPSQAGMYVSSTDACSGGSCFYTDYDYISPANSYAYLIRFFESDEFCDRYRSVTLGGPQLATSTAVMVIAPSQPKDLIGSYDKIAKQVLLIWSPPTSVINVVNSTNNTNYYFIERATKENFSENFINIGSVVIPTSSPILSYRDNNNINENVTYYYRIRACSNSGGCSDYNYNAYPLPSVTRVVAASANISNLRAYVVYVSSTSQKAKVVLAWDSFGSPLVNLKRGTVVLLSSSTLGYYEDTNISFSATPYIYTLSVGATDSISVTLNLNFQYVLVGTAWASAGTASDSGAIGWIKFNSAFGGTSATQNYSVHIDYNGLVSGEAWAGDKFGWLSFNRNDLVGCPSAPTGTSSGAPCEARLSSSTNKLSGWARFIMPADIGFSGSDWGGWVSLSNDNAGISFGPSLGAPVSFFKSILSPLTAFFDTKTVQAITSVPYSVTLNPSPATTFSGAAWGGDIAGWINFNGLSSDGSRYNVGIISSNRPPVVSNVGITVGSQAWCADVSEATYNISWNFSDPENNSQASADIYFIKSGDTTSTYLIHIPDSTTAKTLIDPLSQLSPNTQYRVQVRASDGLDYSNIAESGSFTTPKHYYPLVDFDWVPATIIPPQTVNFNDRTADRSAGEWLPMTWAWTFTNTNNPASNEQNPGVLVRQTPLVVTLTVTDSLGHVCALEQSTGGATSTGAIKRRIFREK